MSTPRKAESTPTRRRSQIAPSVPAQPEPITLPFRAGDVIADKYEVVGILGVGGVAYVISALHLELGEMVALKFLRPESMEHEDVVARFASEARAVARIKSEHVVHVHDVGALPDGTPFIVMECLEGKDLADTLAECGRLPIKVSVDYVLQACEALACAHAAGIVHRDIKPENLFLTQQAASVERVKVLDFGISKSALSAVETSGRRFARTMLPMGTPGYMSPEQIRACGDVDARTDIWALGCVLAELMTGRCAFDAPTLLQLSAVILERDPIPLRKLLPEAPAELEAVILKCLQKDPNQRYQDVAELALALYPFGQRRSRISAERCHQVLKGQQGVVVEFHSIAPPPPSGQSLPAPSSAGAVASAAPISAAVPVVRTTTPAVLEASEVRPQRKRNVAVAALVGLAAVAGVALALRSNTAPGAPTAGAAVPPSPVPVPVTATKAETKAAATTPEASAEGAPAEAEPAPSAASAPVSTASAAARARIARAQRAAAAAAAAQARREAQAAAKAKAPAAKRPALDDSEPDVGY